MKNDPIIKKNECVGVIGRNRSRVQILTEAAMGNENQMSTYCLAIGDYMVFESFGWSWVQNVKRNSQLIWSLSKNPLPHT